jgi:hypothetical protein
MTDIPAVADDDRMAKVEKMMGEGEADGGLHR